MACVIDATAEVSGTKPYTSTNCGNVIKDALSGPNITTASNNIGTYGSLRNTNIADSVLKIVSRGAQRPGDSVRNLEPYFPSAISQLMSF